MAAPKNIIDLVNNLSPFEVSFDPQAYDDLILTHGVSWKHYAAVPCPGSVSDRASNRSKHQDHSCQNGFYYVGGKCFTGVLTNNPAERSNRPEGQLDVSTAVILLPRYYDCPDPEVQAPEQMYFNAYDRIDLNNDDPSTYVTYFEVIETSQTGIDRTRFPICQIMSIIDAYGNQYTPGVDFQIYNNAVKWMGQKRPKFNQSIAT